MDHADDVDGSPWMLGGCHDGLGRISVEDLCA